jgi:hypothetical protein
MDTMKKNGTELFTENNLDLRQLRLEERLKEYRSNLAKVIEEQNVFSKEDCEKFLEQKTNTKYYNPDEILDVREAIAKGEEALLFN